MKKPRKQPVKSVTGSSTFGQKPGKRGIARGGGKMTSRGRTPAGRTSGSGTLHAKGTATGHGAMKKPAPRKTPKKRQWSPGSDVACCSAEALGFLLGWDADRVLELYWRTAGDPDAGATILDTLEALREVMPLAAEPVCQRSRWSSEHLLRVTGPSGVILGVSLPEPHAIAVTPDGRWWSWGEPFNPFNWPDLVIDEAWAIELCAG